MVERHGASLRTGAALWLAGRLPGFGRRRLRALVEGLRGRCDAFLDGNIDPAPWVGRELAERLRAELRPEAIAAAARKLKTAGIVVLTPEADAFPPALREIPDPPAVLYARGRLSLLRRPAIAVVGTRAPSPYGIRAARALAEGLSAAGWCVVSGLAAGIDAAAHAAALEGPGGTIAVLGGGLFYPYPPSNAALFRAIAERGLVLSEYPPDARPHRAYFPERNRLLSGLARGVVVVEGHGRSGALITAAWALEQGRDVFAVPGPIFSPKSDGPNRLIQEGAKLVLGVDDILAEYRPVVADPVLWLGEAKEDREEAKEDREGPPDGAPRLPASETEDPAAGSGASGRGGAPPAADPHSASPGRPAASAEDPALRKDDRAPPSEERHAPPSEERHAPPEGGRHAPPEEGREAPALERRLLTALAAAPALPMDALVAAAGAPAADVLAALTRLELRGWVRRLPGGRYTLPIDKRRMPRP
ncbi:MAG: DNA-protecting protein DprA [Hydrogenibacillus schlegelii]|nr:DNA-protecting protein DprA [Hydrogenibacillus schlegelii]